MKDEHPDNLHYKIDEKLLLQYQMNNLCSYQISQTVLLMLSSFLIFPAKENNMYCYIKSRKIKFKIFCVC